MPWAWMERVSWVLFNPRGHQPATVHSYPLRATPAALCRASACAPDVGRPTGRLVFAGLHGGGCTGPSMWWFNRQMRLPSSPHRPPCPFCCPATASWAPQFTPRAYSLFLPFFQERRLSRQIPLDELKRHGSSGGPLADMALLKYGR